MSITAEQLLLHMSVSERPDVFVVGCFERRVTVLCQQVRAINLIDSLCESGRLRSGSEIAIVGAGMAGLTAAARAARSNARVTLFERERPAHLLEGNRTRWLHPHIYDWPNDGWNEPDANLPVLNWQAGWAGDVVDRVLGEFETISKEGAIEWINREATLDLQPNGTSVVWDGGARSFAAIVLAPGFGIERNVDNSQFFSYWRTESYHQSVLGRENRLSFLVSGCGDGGLIDGLRIRLGDLGQKVEELVKIVLPETEPEVQRIKREILEIERDPATQNPQILTERYQALDKTFIIDRLRPLLAKIGDTRVTFNAESGYPFNPRAWPLNRLLVASLLEGETHTHFIGGSLTDFAQEAGRVKIAGVEHTFDRIVLRHGPESELERTFRSTYDMLQPVLEHTNLLDQSRYPRWQPRETQATIHAELLSAIRGCQSGLVIDLAAALLRHCRLHYDRLRRLSIDVLDDPLTDCEQEAYAFFERYDDLTIDGAKLDHVLAMIERFRERLGDATTAARALVVGLNEAIGKRFEECFGERYFTAKRFVLEPGAPFPVALNPLHEWLDAPAHENLDELDAVSRLGIAPSREEFGGLQIQYELHDNVLSTFQGRIGVVVPNRHVGELHFDHEERDGRHYFFRMRPRNSGQQEEVILRLLDRAVERGVDLVVLPELCVEESTVDKIRQWWRSRGSPAVIVAGSAHVVRDGHRRNESVVLFRGVRPIESCRSKFTRLILQKQEIEHHEDVATDPSRITLHLTARWGLSVVTHGDLQDPKVVTWLARLRAGVILVPTYAGSDAVEHSVHVLTTARGAIVVVANTRLEDGARPAAVFGLPCSHEPFVSWSPKTEELPGLAWIDMSAQPPRLEYLIDS